MKKLLVIMIAACAPFAGATPAAADYHAACPAGSPNSNVDMFVSSGTFNYSGFVNCPGATSITIHSLTLKRPDSSTDSGNAPVTCNACNSLSTNGSDPAGANGTYTVTMDFTASGTGGTFRRIRSADFTWDGAALVRIGSGGGTPSPFNFCDPNLPISEDADFENDNSNPMNPLRMAIHAKVECHGADSMAITQFTLRRQGVSGNTLVGPVRSGTQDAPCVAPCSVVTGQGNFQSDGPGRYRLSFRIAITEGGETRSHTLTQDYLSLGAGPVSAIDE